MFKRDKDNKWMFRKTNDKTEKNDQKIEKNNWKDERHDWKKYLNKNNDQTVNDCDFNVFFARDQYFSEIKIKQKNKINDIN